MALRKAFQSADTGVDLPAAYHLLTRVTIDPPNQTVEAIVVTYRDAAAVAEQRHPVREQQLVFQGDDWAAFVALKSGAQPIGKVLREWLYAQVKLRAQFEGATDADQA